MSLVANLMIKEPLINLRASVGAALAAMGRGAFIAAEAAPTGFCMVHNARCATHQRTLTYGLMACTVPS